MSDVSRFLECVNSAQLYSISTGVKVGDVYYADDVQKAFIHTGTGWAQLETTPLRADNISVSPQISRMIAENLKVFVRELTEEIKNGSLVFNEQEIEQRIDELFRG